MSKRILITGGAGFIGSHLADELLARGYKVRVLDCLSSQVHAAESRPDYLSEDVELRRADILDRDQVARALQGIDAVYHLAAKVGVGQSMYDIAAYTAVNNQGTAILLEELMKRPVERLVVASSMSVYGEGLYEDARGKKIPGSERTLSSLREHDWELRGEDGTPLNPVPTPETKTPCLSSVYALSKYDQERLCLIFGRAYKIPTVALRFFNVYGPRQALSNPYTGVLAIFASRLLNNKAPLIFEDGEQQRDFVNVSDVARACRRALETDAAAGQVFNIGSGEQTTVREIATKLARILGKEHIAPEITGQHRAGDIRHCFADISLAGSVLGYTPRVRFDEGLEELAGWLEGQVATDRFGDARSELTSRGLTV